MFKLLIFDRERQIVWYFRRRIAGGRLLFNLNRNWQLFISFIVYHDFLYWSIAGILSCLCDWWFSSFRWDCVHSRFETWTCNLARIFRVLPSLWFARTNQIWMALRSLLPRLGYSMFIENSELSWYSYRVNVGTLEIFSYLRLLQMSHSIKVLSCLVVYRNLRLFHRLQFHRVFVSPRLLKNCGRYKRCSLLID